MKKVKVQIINSFSINEKGGNPAGVVLDADHLSMAQKQTVAKSVGVSETAFLYQSELADFKVDFFTPTKQIPHCGHATVAAFSYLRQLNQIATDRSSKETIDGLRSIFFEESRAYMEQKSPAFYQLSDDEISQTARALGLKSTDLLALPQIVNTGNSFLIVEVEERVLESIEPLHPEIEKISKKHDLIGFYVFAKPADPAFDATTRMFAPYYGIDEESATGMAAGPLACYLDKYHSNRTPNYKISQGRFMTAPSPSCIYVRLEKSEDQVTRLFAGGDAYVSSTINLNINE
ncbi:phenazine biosynthesis protein PhzF family [Reichenbachiella faecimaris]|uniref:Phenazine biosynthesis protein PhzF family n=1 Tax=Reichenbachiella faecimaris TaxID=692418 RepID=A0A1W2GHM5_REIFA|nr:PhzF family phenazine biosynthesis protein [Reichenbachiella faecimaris]SMD35858.1 phenazine biosynthesis protein PhzF family [Reichenbachiella faecimaris]